MPLIATRPREHDYPSSAVNDLFYLYVVDLERAIRHKFSRAVFISHSSKGRYISSAIF